MQKCIHIYDSNLVPLISLSINIIVFTWPKTFLFTYLNQVTFSVGFLSVLLLRTPSSTSYTLASIVYGCQSIRSAALTLTVTDAMLTCLAFGSWCCHFGSCHFGTWLLVLRSGLPNQQPQSPLQGWLYIEEWYLQGCWGSLHKFISHTHERCIFWSPSVWVQH